MVQVAKNKLHRVGACWQIDGGLRLPTAEVDMIVVGGQAVFQLFRAFFTLSNRRTVQQQVVVTCVFFLRTRRRDAHACKTENDSHGRRNRVAILKADEIDRGIFGCWRTLCPKRRRHKQSRAESDH